MATKKNEHYEYIEKTNPGGAAAYTKTQQDRYNKALEKDDVELIKRLNADAARVGYTLNGAPTATTAPTVSRPPTASEIAARSYVPGSPTYMTGDAMAKNLGIDYNYQNILDKLNTATDAEYQFKNKEYATTENQFYNQMYGAQGTALDTIRKSQAQAIATGASRGLQSANELSSMLGLQQETVMGATDLAQQRNMLKDKEAGAYTQNVVNATDTYNTLGTTMGTLANNKLAADVQNNVGIMEYFKGLDQNSKNLQGSMYAADRGLEGTLDYNKNYLQGVDMSTGRNLEGQLDYNNAYRESSQNQADATKHAADVNAEVQRYVANVNASAQKAYYASQQAQGPDDIFKLLNNAKTEDEYVLAIVGGSQGHISVETAREFYKNRNVKAANDALAELIQKPWSMFNTGQVPIPGVSFNNNTPNQNYPSADWDTYMYK